MKVLLVGGGGREHALAWKLAQSPELTALYATPGSDAIAAHAQCVALEDHEAIAGFCRKEDIGLVVVGPEAPLVAGLADRLRAEGLPVFGPSQAAARLEGSKAFSKTFMKRQGIPTAAFHRFADVEAAEAFVRGTGQPWVVKADGLAAGKGVVVPEGVEDTVTALQQVLSSFAGELVLEEKMTGEELSVFALCDGQDYVLCPSAQDHKPVHDGDTGPNTGGMGAYCPAPLMDAALEQQVVEDVLRPTLEGMREAGHPYVGVLYIGLMITPQGMRVLEYNCRFGDPECQPLLMMLESDLLPLLLAAAQGTLADFQRERPPVWRSGAAATVVMASGGYPGRYATGLPIQGLAAVADSAGGAGRMVFHAGTRQVDGQWVTAGGRVLNVTCHAADLETALKGCYEQVAALGWDGAQFRTDIGQKGLKRLQGS